jgi:hypothetical protein
MAFDAARTAGTAVRAPGRLVLEAVDEVLEKRYEASLEWVVEQRGKRPGASQREVALLAIRQVEKEVTAIGAAVGGAAAVPGTGTGAALAAIAVDITATTARLAEMVLRVAAAYGHALTSLEERRAAVLVIFVGGAGGAGSVEKLAGELGKGLSKKALSRISGQQLRALNKALGRTIITKYGVKRGAITPGRVLPFGIGAAIGGGGNLLVARAIGRYALRFFDDQWGPDADPSLEAVRGDDASPNHGGRCEATVQEPIS